MRKAPALERTPTTKRPLILLSLLALAAVPAKSQTIDALDALHYYEGGAPWARVEYMTLSFSERRITIDCYRNGDDFRKKQNATKRRDHVCTEKEWRDIEGWLAAARIGEWADDYPSEVCDGTLWRLEFLSGTNVLHCIRGDNNWPKRFFQFRKVKDFAMKLPEEMCVEAKPHAKSAEPDPPAKSTLPDASDAPDPPDAVSPPAPSDRIYSPYGELCTRYIIAPRDTLSRISAATGVPMETIVRMNRLQDPNRIKAGDELYLPYRIGTPEGMLVPPWPRATNAPATPSPAEESHAEGAE